MIKENKLLILKMLREGISIKEIAKNLNKSNKTIYQHIKDLSYKGYLVKIRNELHLTEKVKELDGDIMPTLSNLMTKEDILYLNSFKYSNLHLYKRTKRSWNYTNKPKIYILNKEKCYFCESKEDLIMHDVNYSKPYRFTSVKLLCKKCHMLYHRLIEKQEMFYEDDK